MALKLCVVASGSSGNCIYVASGETRLLIDAGLSGRETQRRFGELGVDLGGISAVCVSHEHEDHCQGLPVLHQRHGVKLYANAGTIEAIERGKRAGSLAWQVFTTGAPFTVGGLRIEPFPVPHDAYDPVGFVIADGASRVGIVTDMGMATTVVRERLRHCAAVVMECNYDEEMLRNSNRPWSLKQRIMGRQGHMSNAQAAELLAEVAGPHLQHVFLAHISSDCNRPESAMASVRRALEAVGQGHVGIKLTYGDRVSETVEV